MALFGDKFECTRCGRKAEPLGFAPVPNELGQRVADEICKDCWAEWQKKQMQLINHFGLDVSNAGVSWILLGALLSVGHMITTAQAAPNLLQLRPSIPADGELEVLYGRFAGWSGVRTLLQVSTFIVVVVALIATR